jgi:flagellar hook-associated protein 1 FlgK
VAVGANGNAPNDLLDHRDGLLAKLSEYTPIQTSGGSNGVLNVSFGNGVPLVVDRQVYPLELGRSSFDPSDLVVRQQGQAKGTDLSGQIKGGRLGAYLSFRNEVLNPAQDRLGLLASGVAATFNAQHRAGMDLEGELGGDFFTLGQPRVLDNSANQGDAALAVTISDIEQLPRSNYEVRHDGSRFSVLRLSDNTQVAEGVSGPLHFDGLTLEVASGTASAGDRFLIQPTRSGASDFGLRLTHPEDIAAASPVKVSAAQGNLGSATISFTAVADAANPALLNSVDIRFTGADTFDIVDAETGTVLVADQAYTADEPIAFNGWEVRISGSPQSGDHFSVGSNAGALGDNGNARLLAGLNTTPTLLNGTSSHQDLHGTLLGEVGTKANQAHTLLASQAALFAQAVDARNAISAVNLDEEAADLLRFQQAYQAAAQMMQVADSLFQTLLGSVGS